MARFYRIREFAGLAGVTIKALRHYDRLGLLRPKRTAGGYRLYTELDLERLEQIVALKFLGLPLKQIQTVLDREALGIADALRFQRHVLEEKQQLLERAVRVLREGEGAIGSGKRAAPEILKRIIEVMAMQDSIDVMKKYYGEEAWVKCRPRFERWLSPEWQEFQRQAEALLGADPASEEAQALGARWIGFLRLDLHLVDDPAVEHGDRSAFADREHWPPALKDWYQDVARVRVFIGEVITRNPGKFFSEKDRSRILSRMGKTKFSADWHQLLLETSQAAAGDPGGAAAQVLAARWRELSGGGAHIQPGKFPAWVERQHWPDETRSLINSLDVEKLAEFVQRAEARLQG